MEKFLDKRSLRTLEITNLFFNIKDTWTISEISTKIDVSYKTVKKDLEELKIKFDDYYSENSETCLTTDGTSFVLTIPDDFNYKEVYAFFLEDSIPYCFIRDLFLNQKITKYQFMSRYYIGYTAFLKRYPIVQTMLSNFSLTLQETPELEIIGEEKQIRLFAIYFFLTDYNYCGHSHLLEKYDEIGAVLKKIHKTVEEKIGYFMNSFELKKYNIISAVAMLRIRRGSLIGDITEFKTDAKASLLYDILCAEMNEVIGGYGLSEDEILNEIIFLIAIIRTQPALEGNESYNKKNLRGHREKYSIGWMLTDTFIENIEAEIGLSKYENTEFLLNNLISLHFQSIHFVCDLTGYNNGMEEMSYREQKIWELLVAKKDMIFSNMANKLSPENAVIFLQNSNFLLTKYYNILRGIITPEMFLEPVYINVFSIQGNYIEKDVGLKIKINLSDFNIQIVEKDNPRLDLLIVDAMDKEEMAPFEGKIFSYNGIFTKHDYVRLLKYVIVINEKKTIK